MKLTYWKKYDKLYKNFSMKSIYKIILSFAQKLESPYEKSSKYGPKEKVTPVEYASYIILMMAFKGATYRQMEMESNLYLGIHIDHSTFALNFEKIPTKYYLDFIEKTSNYLDRLLKRSNQIAIDSTAITSANKNKTIIKGKIVNQKIEYRTHVIASIHKENNSVCIKRALSTTKKIADCEGAKLMINKGGLENNIMHADRGYDYERVYESCYLNKIQPNIRPLGYRGAIDYRAKEGSKRLQGIIEYNDLERKKYRGIIETIFGGLTNAGLLITRLKKEIRIISYGAAIMLRHNIQTILRNMS